MARGARQNKFKVQINGAKELGDMLDSMGDQADKILDEAVWSGGEIGLAAAKANAPVGDTGKLKRNITMKPVKVRQGSHKTYKTRKVKGAVTIGFNRTKKGAADDAYYGSFVELGTKYQKAKFFLRDAVDKNKQRIANAIIRRFNRLKG